MSSSLRLGGTLALLSAASFGTSGSFASALIAAGWSPAAAVTVRITVAAIVLTIPAALSMRGRWHRLRHNGGAVLAYGLVAVAGCQLCYFNSLRHLSVAVALLLEYMGILLVIGWMWLRHGQRPNTLTWVGGGLALVGLVLVLNITEGQHVDTIGLLWAVGAALGLAVYFVISSTVAQPDEPQTPVARAEPLPPIAMAWGGMVIAALALLICDNCGLMYAHAPLVDVSLHHHRVSWLVPVLGLSVLAAAVAYVAGIGAARRLGARSASFFGLTEVLFAVIFAWVLLDQRPGSLQLIGGVLTLAGVVLVRMGEAGIDVDPATADGAILALDELAASDIPA